MVREGQVAIIHFTGRLWEGKEAGAVFDTTDVDVALAEEIYHDHRDYMPLEFRVGEGKVIEGIDSTVREMAVGETRTVRIQPDEAFGEYSEERVIEYPREELEETSEGEPTENALVRSDTGETGWVTDVTDETVTVDFNHELAGEQLQFEIEVLDAHGGHDE